MKRSRIVLRPEAERDLEEIAAYIGRDGPSAALRFLDAAQAAFEALAAAPLIGSARRFRSRRLAGVRLWPIPDFDAYLIIYRPMEDGVDVSRVLHGARDLLALLRGG